jgi:hypothetical protein
MGRIHKDRLGQGERHGAVDESVIAGSDVCLWDPSLRQASDELLDPAHSLGGSGGITGSIAIPKR